MKQHELLAVDIVFVKKVIPTSTFRGKPCSAKAAYYFLLRTVAVEEQFHGWQLEWPFGRETFVTTHKAPFSVLKQQTSCLPYFAKHSPLTALSAQTSSLLH